MDIIRSDETGPDGFVAILGALPRELVYIRSKIKIQRKVHQKGVRFWVGSYGVQKIVLVQTGIGPSQAQQATRVTLSCFPVKAIISVGFACALHPGMKIGDLVVGESASFLSEDPCRPGPYPADDRLLLLAGEVSKNTGPSGLEQAAVYQGPLLTVRRIIEDAAEKRTLARTSGAIALDMESAAVAGAAADAQIAYLPVRAISDLVDENLSGMSHFFSSEGTFRPLRGLLYLLSHPNDLAHLSRLRAHTITASQRLGCFIHNYLHYLN
jgi:adenosylhomocysteine nucleosidase